MGDTLMPGILLVNGIESDNEDLEFDCIGAGKTIKFKRDGVEVASIGDGGISGDGSQLTGMVTSDLTVLADYPSRKYSGSLTFSESIYNFNFVVFKTSYHTGTQKTQFWQIPTEAIVFDQYYEVLEVYNNVHLSARFLSATTGDLPTEYASKLWTVYGMGRK